MKLVILAVLAASLVMAQSVPMTQTTLVLPMDNRQQNLNVAAATGITSPGIFGQNRVYLYVDTELMSVSSVVGTGVVVQRGVNGTRAEAHNAGAVVYVGPGNQFSSSTPAGACTDADWPVTPRIVPSTGLSYTCSSGVWVSTTSGGTTLTLTTTGTSGPATLVGDVLNIPQYTGGASGFTVTRTSSTVLNVTAGTVRINGAFFDVAASVPTVVSGSGSVLAYVSADGAMTIAPATGVTVTCASPCVVLPAVTTPAFPANSIGVFSATVASGAWPADGSIIRYAGAVELAAINPGSGMSETNVAGVRTFNVTAATRRMTVPAIDAGLSASGAARLELDGNIINMAAAGSAFYPINQLPGESITSVNVSLDFRIEGFGGGSDTLLAAIGCEAVAASQAAYVGTTFGSTVTFTPASLAFRGYRSGNWTLTLGSACTAPDRPVVRFTRTGTDAFYLGSMAVAVNN